ncbi:pectate lyase [Catalinimonas alkaloidigena]|uniref:T9SS type A sorting domain-containing protein n=1 Tax=Catalinimonas alkaloidigena TaxID=1075417 RepID=UPI002405DDFE|nr:T9SS type A sorting domain-containing protein [Catalinimonas alkaloidigena]MDF9801089.1 pectate lyase [Catalinimonas alkaloidigena]
MMLQKLPLTLLFIILCCNICYSQIPAFPGAEGFGTNTIGGREGRVIKVTNLNDNGPGSLREAIELDEPRIIVFTISGIINLDTKLTISNPFVTIAGQTSPGEGICIRGEGLQINSHDIVIRFLRIRPGDINFGEPNQWSSVDGISIGGSADEVYNVVLDHCSISWAVDENVGIWGAPHDITIQNCIISEALHRSKHPKGDHGMGMLIGGKSTNISIHHNLFAHNNDRNPHINGQSKVDFRNNIIYNPGGKAIDLSGTNKQYINLVNNYIVKGPYTNTRSNILLRDTASTPKLFIEGNIGINQKSPSFNNWVLVRDLDNRIPNNQMRLQEEAAHPKVTTYSALEAYSFVQNNAGAILPIRDAVDRKIVYDLENRKGSLVNSKDHLLEWPILREGIPFIDSDGDGMPDHWEESFGLNKFEDDSFSDNDDDGYVNIEEYLNKTNPVGNSENTNANISLLSSESPEYSNYYSNLVFGIDKLYPNPLEDTATSTMEFTIDKPAKVSLKVFDEDGKEVAELVKGFLYEGKYEIGWDTTGLEPGMYIVSLVSKKEARSIKAIINP